jgi:transcriptional regulator with XRE-family HTH domain
MLKDFARRLTALRESRGWTMYRLGKASGLTPEAVSKLEQGQTDPKLTTLAKLAAGLGIDVCGLLRDGGKKPRRRKAN